jgi:4-hydroxy-2-oxoglutarate aldolase
VSTIDLAGVFAPMTTPFDRVSGDLDPVGFRRNARDLLAAPIDGLVLFGSTGEGVLLDEEERIAGMNAVRTLTEDRLLLAGVASESTRGAIRMARAAAEAGMDAVLVPPPAYYRPQMTAEALRHHYQAVADASPLPVVLYQVPTAYSGIELRAGLVAELAQHANVAGIKDSSGDLHALGQLVETCPRDFAVLVGSGAIFYGGLEVGARGGILAVAVLAPEPAAALFRAFREGRSAEAGAIQEKLAPLHRAIVGALGVPGVKAALDLLGRAGGPPRPPLRPVRERERNAVDAALREAGLM